MTMDDSAKPSVPSLNQSEPGFHLKKVTRLESGLKEAFLPESDLCIQEGDSLYQFEYKREHDQKSIVVTPGTYNLVKQPGGVNIDNMEFVERKILTSIANTNNILKEADFFFNNLSIYEELNQPKKRGVLLYGKAGCGKTCSIIEAAKILKTKDAGAVVINWPTSELEASHVFKFFTSYSQYSPECTKLILIIEDIGGGSHEGYSRRDEVSSSLLNLLDGVSNVFKLPTLILATTNHAENLMASIAQRPGRFDMMMEIVPPPYDERINLTEFIARRELTAEEKESLNGNINKGAEDFSIAHLQEIVIRSRLHNKSIDSVIKELIKHAKDFSKDFQKPKKAGAFGFNLDE